MLYRKCSQCGVNNFKPYKQEDDQSDSAHLVWWEKYVVCGKDDTGKNKNPANCLKTD